MASLRSRQSLVAAGIVFLLCAAGIAFATTSASSTRTFYLSPAGNDSASGSSSAPFRTFSRALEALSPGDTLLVRGGTYEERVKNPSLAKATAGNRITVKAHDGERPVIRGLLWLRDADYWTFEGINVTWSSKNSSSEHMVKFTGGVGWRFTAAEVWDARSYAAILLAGSPRGWSLDNLHVHHTHKTNSTNQDHLIYVNGGTGGGVIERSILTDSPNGRAIKIGPPSSSSSPVGNVVVRYNTMVRNTGPSNVQLSYGASGNSIYRNIMQSPGAGNEAVTSYRLNGTGNTVSDNVVWDARGALSPTAGLADGGGNLMIDPRLDQSYRPLNTAAQAYGRYAGTSPGKTVVEAPEKAPTAPTTTSPPVTAAPTTSAPSTTTVAPTTTASTTTTAAPTTTSSTTTAAPTTTRPRSSDSRSPLPDGDDASVSAVSATTQTRELVLPTPEGTQAGDLLVAAVATRGNAVVSPPAGWTLVHADDHGDVMTTWVFTRSAQGTEPKQSTWKSTRAVPTSGAIVRLSGIDASQLTSAGQLGPFSKSIAPPRAPAQTGLVFYVSANSTAISAPAGVSPLAWAATSTRSSNVSLMAGYFPSGDKLLPANAAKPGWTSASVLGLG